MLDQLKTIPTDAGAGFLAGVATEIKQDEIQGHPFIFNPLTGEIKSLENLLSAPLRQKISRPLFTVCDFIAYVNRFKRPETTVYCTDGLITAVIDHRGTEAPTWDDHAVTVKIDRSEPLLRWLEKNKKPLSQEEFADFLEERALEIVVPQAAEILELVQELHVTKNSSVRSSVRNNGRHSIAFNQDQQIKGAGGGVDLPTSFEIRIEPFKRQKVTTDIRALLRVKLREEKPVFVFDLQRVEERLEQALGEITETISDLTKLPVYR